ncbi:hypothetical protein BE17_00620 [Sorangium cellulosum]|uniref:Uncharacterized protein n=1 Tax=Sorangium cellulosum TaxID=56 RepID=A0A150SEY7_SORCE|nr:hypothetical protein BE17_00620 [Sorangium cellulosum]
MNRASSSTLRVRTTSRLAASKPPSEPRRTRAPLLAAVAYYGVETQHGAMVIKRSGESADLLPARNDAGELRGFGWGYFGAGPFELAVALLTDAIGAEAASRFAWGFCVDVAATLPRDGGWTLTRTEVRAHARAAGWKG